MKHKCYTYGYQGKSVEAFIQKLNKDGILLVDIRCSPRSRAKNWNQSSLMAALGDNYLHLPELGNVNYKGGIIRIANMDEGCKTILHLLNSRPLVLMCVCQDLQSCHRNFVAGELENILPELIIEEFEL